MSEPIIVGIESHEFVGEDRPDARCAGILGYSAGHPRHGEPCGYARSMPIHTPATMNREQRIAERTRDLLDEIVSVELHPTNLDPYPASVGEVADEIARFVRELDASGAARGLTAAVLDWFQTYQQEADWAKPNPEIPRECRQGDHRDGNVTATHAPRAFGHCRAIVGRES